MIHDGTFPIKNISLGILLFAIGILIAFIVFISLISIRVGCNNMQQEGFWVPILAGILVISGCLWFYFMISRFISGRMKEKNIINNI